MKDQRVVLQIKGLEKTFGQRKVLKGLNLAVKTGSCLALLGPNGAGKTTTIRIILGIVTPTDGEISVFGLKYPKGLKQAKYNIGVVPQMDNLDPDLTILENLLVYANYFKIKSSEAKKRALKLLDFFALKNRKDEIIQNLSGGQRRRLLLARALINKPSLLILDEPTIGLDPQARLLMWERLEELRKIGTTMLLTSHYMEEVAKLATNVIIIDNGKPIIGGNPKEIVTKYLGSELIEIKGKKEKLTELSEKLKDCDVDTELFEDRLFIYIKNGCEKLDNATSKMHHVIKRPTTLEDLFLKLTGRRLRET